MREALRRWSYRLLMFALFVVAAYVLFLLGRRVYEDYGPDIRLDERLPEGFHLRGSYAVFAAWVAGLGVASGLAARRLFGGLRADLARGSSPTDGPVDAPAAQAVYLLAGPTEEDLDRLLDAAGLGCRGRALVRTEPGPCVYLKQPWESEPGDEAQEDRPHALDAGIPGGANRLRGIFFVLPIDEIERRGAPTAENLRDRHRAIRAGLDVDVPAYLVFTGLERIPGFAELAIARGNQAEWGVALGRPRAPGDLRRELSGFADRIRRRILRMMRKNVPDRAGNARLYGVGARFDLMRAPLAEFCEAAFPDEPGDPPFLRGVFLAATGDTPERRAYASYPLRLQAREDQSCATWSAAALAADREERRRGWRLAARAGLAAAAAWSYILLGLGTLGLAGPVIAAALAIAWGVVLVSASRRSSATAGGQSSR